MIEVYSVAMSGCDECEHRARLTPMKYSNGYA
jgi:hypothetical protein